MDHMVLVVSDVGRASELQAVIALAVEFVIGAAWMLFVFYWRASELKAVQSHILL